MRRPAVYIGDVVIDPSVAAKINTKHQLTEADVREALLSPACVVPRWDDHPVHGLRLIVKATTSAGRPILAWLEPVDAADGTWALRSARAGT